MTDINNDEAIAIQGFKDHFGTCPHCHDFGGFINIGRGHWFFCDEHRVKWCVGSDLFDCWRDQTEKEQRAIYDAKGFGSYQDVVPYSPRLITIETSCGKHFELHVSELSDRQLSILLAGNSERSDVDPAHIAAMRDELQRREELCSRGWLPAYGDAVDDEIPF
jgi:hypothetical protein